MDWDMENKEGLRKQIKKCVFQVLAEEVPRLRGAIDGLQGGVNEARNRSMETKATVEKNVVKFVGTLKAIEEIGKQRLIK
jgi:hypothetical protein